MNLQASRHNSDTSLTINHRLFSQYGFLLCMPHDEALVRVLLLRDRVSTGDLQKACGLARSSTLNRLKRLGTKGLVVKCARIGTEGRKMPHYQFTISDAINKAELTAFLNSRKQSFTPSPEIDLKSQSFEKQVEIVMIAMAKEINKLKDKVTVLEGRI